MKDEKFPVRTEIEVLSVDESKQIKLGFVITEYLGSKCYLASDPNQKPITNREDLKIGDELVAWNEWIALKNLKLPRI